MKHLSTILRSLQCRRVGVLFGGWSAEREISLKSGKAVCQALARKKIPYAAIDVTRRSILHIRRAKIDIAFLAMHGPFGEDGTLQGLLETLDVPYTGSGVLASAAAMHKPTAKRIFEAAGLPTPRWFTVKKGEREPRVPSFTRRWIVKPASQGSAIGVSLPQNESQYHAALRKALAVDYEALVEEYVPGKEITVGILGHRALPVIEILPKHSFYDFYSKYAKGGSRHLLPARLPETLRHRAADMALRAFEVLGCRHLGRVDLMVSRAGHPTILEVNTLPGLTDTSLLPDAAQAVGMDFDHLILEILFLALADAHKRHAQRHAHA